MAKNTKITEEVKSRIVELVQSGIPNHKIAEILNISRPSVSKYSKLAGVNKAELKERLRFKTIELYKDGKSMRDISKHTSLAYATVQRYINAEGIERAQSVKYGTKRRNLTKKEIKEVHQLFKEGVSQSDISRKLYVSRQIISYHLKPVKPVVIKKKPEVKKRIEDRPLSTIDRITGRIKVRLDRKTEIYFEPGDDLHIRVERKKQLLGIR